MKSSLSIINLAKALLKFQSNVGSIGKDGKANYGKFASLPKVLEVIKPVLSECGLVVMQMPSGDGIMINIETILIHAETGEFITSEVSMKSATSKPQEIGSCITYMRRYSLGAILSLNIDDDDDGNVASGRKSDGSENLQEKSSEQMYVAIPNKSGKPYDAQQIAPVQQVKAASLETFESVKAHIDFAQTLDDLKEIGKEIAAIEKTDSQRAELAKAYKERMEYIKGGEGI